MTALQHSLRRATFLARYNPGLLFELARRRVPARLPSATTEGRIGLVRFTYEFDLDADIAAMWLGRYEVPIVRLLRQYLRPGGTFVDVGANIGYITAQAANLVGPGGRVVALEPIGCYHDRLKRLADRNPRYRIAALKLAAGQASGRALARISKKGNIGYNSLAPKWVPDRELGATEEVEVVPLDDVVVAQDLDRLDLLKIDTEGFELPVLEGARRTLGLFRPPIIMEITPSAAQNHGKSLLYLADLIGVLGYRAYPCETPTRLVDLSKATRRIDVLLVPR
jgi:FkbM family methyltransferase